MQRYTTGNSVCQWFNDVLIIFQCSSSNTTQCTTIFFSNNYILGYIHQTTSQVTGISCFKSGIRQTFTGTVGRDKVIQYIQSTFKVGKNWILNDLGTTGT